MFVFVGLAGFHDGASKNQREANAENKDNGIENTEENGVVRYRVTYNDKHDDSDLDDFLLWQTVFMPLLN